MEAMSTTMEATKVSREDDLWKNVELGLRSKGIELGIISDEEIRRLMKIELENRIKWGKKPTPQEQLAQQLDFIKTLRGMKISTETDRAHNSKFYDTPRSFDLLVAGNTLKESTGLWNDATTTVDEAATKMMDLYCERANIEDGQTILDLGCGCGPLVLHIAKKYKNCKVTGVTDELSQKQYILEQCKNLNLSNVEIVIGDVTSLDMERTFDRVFGIQVIEHLKNFGLFLREISKWMKDDGFFFLEHLCNKTFSYHAEEPLSEDDWYHTYCLPTGTLASAACLLYFQEDVTVMDHWLVSGNHYSRTCEECWKAIDGNIEEIKDIFMSYYGIGEEDAVKRIKWWRIVFIITEEQFKYNNGVWMVTHLLFKKK